MINNIKKYTVSETASLIKQMETDLGLLKDETYGLHARYVWEATRLKLHYFLNRKYSLHGIRRTPNISIQQMSWSVLICFIGRFLYSIIIKNWIWAPRKRDWLVFHFIRHKKVSGCYEDIFTDDLIDEIGIEKCVAVERPDQRRHYIPQRHRVFHSEFLTIISKILTPFLTFFFKYDIKAINNMILNIKMYVKNVIGQNIDIEKLFKVKALFVSHISHLFMLKWLKPKRIIVVGEITPLIWAASILHIPTIELQHGVITSEQLDYSVPVGMTKKLFPDYLLLFGRYWKEITDNFPLPPKRLIILGYPYFERMTINHNNLIKRNNQIVVISQGTIGGELSKFAIKLASIKKGIFKVIYKLHPDERSRAKKLYSELFEAEEQGLLEVVDTDEPALYTLFSQSRWQIGVYSTALFEGIALGCQLILVDIPGVEYMVPLLNKGYAQLVKTPEEIQFKETENAEVLREELFASNWRTNWHEFEKMDLQSRY